MRRRTKAKRPFGLLDQIQAAPGAQPSKSAAVKSAGADVALVPQGDTVVVTVQLYATPASSAAASAGYGMAVLFADGTCPESHSAGALGAASVARTTIWYCV